MTQDNKQYATSLDYRPTGITVLPDAGNGFARQVHTADALQDNDLINVAGMQMKAAQARELGLLGQVFEDDSLNAGSASVRTGDETTEPAKPVEPKSDTGNADYDTAMDKLNEYIDEGSMTIDEAKEYDVSLAKVAFAGLQVEHVAETLEGLANGTVDQSAVPPDVLKMVGDVETQVTQASTKAAVSELGQQGFDALTNLSATHPGVSEVITRYAIDRAQGRHQGVTWPELYADLQEQLGII